MPSTRRVYNSSKKRNSKKRMQWPNSTNSKKKYVFSNSKKPKKNTHKASRERATWTKNFSINATTCTPNYMKDRQKHKEKSNNKKLPNRSLLNKRMCNNCLHQKMEHRVVVMTTSFRRIWMVII